MKMAIAGTGCVGPPLYVVLAQHKGASRLPASGNASPKQVQEGSIRGFLSLISGFSCSKPLGGYCLGDRAAIVQRGRGRYADAGSEGRV